MKREDRDKSKIKRGSKEGKRELSEKSGECVDRKEIQRKER